MTMKQILRKSKKSLPETKIYESVNLINNVLYEERTVSEEVRIITMSVYNMLVKAYHNTEFTVVADGILLKKGTFPYGYNGVNFNVNWLWYRYSSQKFTDDVLNADAQCDIRKKEITVRIFSLDGEYLKPSVYEALQHEIFHFFERMKMKHPYRGVNYYMIATKILKELKETKDMGRPYNKRLFEAKQHIANIIYLSYRFEQRAYVNGAYMYIVGNVERGEEETPEEIKYDDEIVGTVLFVQFTKLKDAFDYLKGKNANDPFLIEALRPYNLSYEKIYEICEKAIYSFSRYIGRLKSKVVDDFQEIHEVFDMLDEFRLPFKIDKRDDVSIEKMLKKHLLI